MNYLLSENRAVSPALRWLAVEAPDLARSVRPGQFLLLQVGSSYDPWLPVALPIAAAEERLARIGLLVDAASAVGQVRAGESLTVAGLLGRPIELSRRSRTLLLLGQGAAIGALLFLAQVALAKGIAVALLASGVDGATLPPAFLLPPEIEYEGQVGPEPLLPDAARLRWADQVITALPRESLPALRDRVVQVRLRPEPEYVQCLLTPPMTCAGGFCNSCLITTRKGPRIACSDGPTFALRELEL